MDTTYTALGEFEDCFGVWRPRQKKPTQVEQPSLYSLISEQVDQTSNIMITAKFDKLGTHFLEDIHQSLLHMCTKFVEQPRTRTSIDIRFEVLQVDHANLQQLPKFYQQLKLKTKNTQRDKLIRGTRVAYNDEEIRFHTKLTHLPQERTDKSQILDVVFRSLQQQQEHPAQVYTSIFLIECIHSVPELITLQKCIKEEIEFNLPCDNHRTVVLVLPATEQLIVNYQLNGLTKRKYIFTDPKKMFISLLIDLLKNSQVPIFSRALYKVLTDSFSVYATTYAEQVHHVKVGLSLFCKTFPYQDRLRAHLNDEVKKNEPFKDYLQMRHSIKFGLDTLQLFMSKLKQQQDESLRKFRVLDTKQKLLSVICMEVPSFFQLQSAEDATLNDLLQMFLQSIRQCMPEDDGSCQQIEMWVMQGYQPPSKSKKDRALQLLQASQDSETKLLSDKKTRLEQAVNKFIQQNIIEILIKLENQKSEYVFKDASLLQDHFAPDILEKYHMVLYKDPPNIDPNNKNILYTPYFHTRNLYSAIGAAGCLTKASDLINEMPTYPVHQRESFLYSVTEMRLLGLIEETKKVQPTYQKTFFAKSAYQLATN